MFKKNILIPYLTGISVLLVYSTILYMNYNSIEDVVPTNINYTGEIDSYGNKRQLWITSFVNLILILFIGFLIKNPHIPNYPIEITEENKNKVYYKMQLFLSYLSIITSILFSLMIFNALKYTTNEIITLLSSIIIPPILLVNIFNFKGKT